MEVLKADQNIGKNPMFLNAAGILITKFNTLSQILHKPSIW
jgi:hypothetical protein